MSEPAKPSTLPTRWESPQTVGKFLRSMQEQIQIALPRHMRADQFIRVAMTTLQRNPALLECTPESLVGCMMQSAQLGLPVDGVLGYAYLVPFKTRHGKVCTLITGYKGKIDLAYRSGRVASIDYDAVFQGDVFRVKRGLKPDLIHDKRSTDRTGQNVIASWAAATLKGGGGVVVALDRIEIEQHRARSRSANDGPWVTDYAEMACKTAVHLLCKRLPLSPEVQTQLAQEDSFDAGIDVSVPEASNGAGAFRPNEAAAARLLAPESPVIVKASDKTVPDGPLSANELTGFVDLCDKLGPPERVRDVLCKVRGLDMGCDNPLTGITAGEAGQVVGELERMGAK